ncbi:hypothetical protein [Maridesulfovibrio sp.]|uniref:hypothetical protein n=1 Tax=Maridesulfovibrio sp. TaxID=2795000 RepID=UPI0029F584E1|nr:hypothetical protein [Maridesulfovibrio sp.]
MSFKFDNALEIYKSHFFITTSTADQHMIQNAIQIYNEHSLFMLIGAMALVIAYSLIRIILAHKPIPTINELKSNPDNLDPEGFLLCPHCKHKVTFNASGHHIVVCRKCGETIAKRH